MAVKFSFLKAAAFMIKPVPCSAAAVQDIDEAMRLNRCYELTEYSRKRNRDKK
jgi:hypothetical protein